jgi:hypothetical protein
MLVNPNGEMVVFGIRSGNHKLQVFESRISPSKTANLEKMFASLWQ